MLIDCGYAGAFCVIREYGTSWQFIIFFRTHCMPSGEFSCVEWEAVELLSFPRTIETIEIIEKRKLLAPKPQSILQWAIRNIIGLSKGEKNETSTYI